MLFLVDRFHSGPISCAPTGAVKRYATHTCSPTLFIDSYPQHKHTITTASEGINSGLKRSAASLQQITSIRRLMSRVTTILDTLFKRSKYAVYHDWSNNKSSPLRELIKATRRSQINCFSIMTPLLYYPLLRSRPLLKFGGHFFERRPPMCNFALQTSGSQGKWVVRVGKMRLLMGRVTLCVLYILRNKGIINK